VFAEENNSKAICDERSPGKKVKISFYGECVRANVKTEEGLKRRNPFRRKFLAEN
jgi:hypothetical protein